MPAGHARCLSLPDSLTARVACRGKGGGRIAGARAGARVLARTCTCTQRERGGHETRERESERASEGARESICVPADRDSAQHGRPWIHSNNNNASPRPAGWLAVYLFAPSPPPHILSSLLLQKALFSHALRRHTHPISVPCHAFSSLDAPSAWHVASWPRMTLHGLA